MDGGCAGYVGAGFKPALPRPTSNVPAPCAVFASAAALTIRRASRREAIQCRERNIRLFRSRHWIASHL
ncbi:MAG: hypothetical protein LBM98_12085 [Oscillospiraceae bacterium]|nr:hypothetical protein [Oscillospiraceae bacterium]